MKNYVITFIFFATSFITEQLFGKCGAGDISIWPQTKTISETPTFIIEGYGFEQETVKHLNQKGNMFLISENEYIPLSIKIIKGKIALTQAIIRPLKKLSVGKTYKLVFPNSSKHEKNELGKQGIEWIVVSEKKSYSKWKCEPRLFQYIYEEQSCGPHKIVKFCCEILSNSPTAIHARLFEESTNKISEYYLLNDSNIIEVGRKMCSGAFDFIDKSGYYIDFALLNSSNNDQEEFTKPIHFISPRSGEIKFFDEIYNCSCDVKPAPENKTAILYFSILSMIVLLGLSLRIINGSH
jgi:hypothetical protein